MIRPAGPALSRWVDSLWHHARTGASGDCVAELPSGVMHVAIRLVPEPIRLVDPGSGVERGFGHAVLAGARDHAYLRLQPAHGVTVGAQLRPGAARALFGIDAGELAGRHLPLAAVLGAEAGRWRDRLLAATGPAARMALLEQALLARQPSGLEPDPMVAAALARFAAGADVASVVAAAGCSHRHFIARFVRAVGLPPQRWRRVRRFQRLLAAARAAPAAAWSDLALAAGYSDQAHAVREFRRLAGTTPGAWRRGSLSGGGATVNSVQDHAPGGG
jgi:AraC-like DNA-binding protein